MIKLGRYQIDHVPRESRLCPLCKLNQIESETFNSIPLSLPEIFFAETMFLK